MGSQSITNDANCTKQRSAMAGTSSRRSRTRYAFGSVQISRGCPFTCEFCDIIVVFGRRPRIKGSAQVIAELDALSALGKRDVFIVDDNLIGNKKAIKVVLQDLVAWQRANGYKMSFFTEASLDLADDAELMQLMVDVNIDTVYVTGIWVAERLGGDDLALLAGFTTGIVLTAYKIAMFFRLRAPVGAAILAAAGAQPGGARRFAAASWHWFFIALSTLVFLLALEEFAVGNNPRTAGATTALQTVIVAFGMVWAAKHRL
jgi:hypothetical protein